MVELILWIKTVSHKEDCVVYYVYVYLLSCFYE